MPFNPLPTDPNFGTLYNANYPVNIYLTIDSASVDVTAFNGVSTRKTRPVVGWVRRPGANRSDHPVLLHPAPGDQTVTGATTPSSQSGQKNLLWVRELATPPPAFSHSHRSP